MHEPKNRGRIDWVNIAIYGGISVLTVVVWSLALIGAAWLLGLLP
jgi:hypothetical protein